jgi:hypothetical protein
MNAVRYVPPFSCPFATGTALADVDWNAMIAPL